MFVGDSHDFLFLLEVIFRTVVMYAYALLFARVIGKRAVGQISPFEFILIIIISSAAGDPMFYAHVPLLHGMAVMTVVMILHRLVGPQRRVPNEESRSWWFESAASSGRRWAAAASRGANS